MNSRQIFDDLLAMGRTESFEAVVQVRGAGNHDAVVRLAYMHREAAQQFMDRLSQPDRAAFVKAVAVYEDTVRGIGSVTLLYALLPRVADPDHATIDWVLRRTESYGHYAHGAKSYDEYVTICRWRAERAAEGLRRDGERQDEDRRRIAVEATGKLFNAVRRGDLKAVRALLGKGADPSFLTPGGQSLVSFAIDQGRHDIASLLQEHIER